MLVKSFLPVVVPVQWGKKAVDRTGRFWDFNSGVIRSASLSVPVEWAAAAAAFMLFALQRRGLNDPDSYNF